MKVLRPFLVVLVAGALLVFAPATAHADPAVASVSPGGALNTSAAPVTIEGTGFLPGARVALVERHTASGPDEGTPAAALDHGRVSLDGTTISGVVLDTLGQAPTRKNDNPTVDVTWYVTVTNPDGKVSARPFAILGEAPVLTSASPNRLRRGTTTTVTVTGDNLARKAKFVVENPATPHNPPPSDGDFEIELSNVTWKNLRTYTIDVYVPKEYAASDGANNKSETIERSLKVTNTDAQTHTASEFLTVEGVPAKIPSVTKINKSLGSNSDANDEFSVVIEGGNFHPTSQIRGRLIGHCPPSTPLCPMNGRSIDLDDPQSTPGMVDPRLDSDELSGTFDLVMAAPGRYSIEVTNLGTPNGVGLLANAFEVIAGPPRITPPAAPVELKAGQTKTFDIDGSDFATGDSVTIPDTEVVVESLARTRITVRATPKSNVSSGARDLTVRHTNGVAATCGTCVRTVASPLANPTPSATDRYISAVYRLFMKRTPTATEYSRWRTSVNSDNRLALTRELANSDEFAGTQIDLLYRSILGRASDSAGRAYWLDQVRRGTRLDQIASYFYGGTEFFQRSGSTNGGYVDQLYLQILGRTADDGGRRYWVGELDSGRLDRSGVATWFYAGIESRRQRAQRQYVLVFGTAPSSAKREELAGRIGSVGDLVVAAELAASREYYVKVTT